MRRYKIVFLDTYYPPVLSQLPHAYDYHQHMENVYAQCFGTADFYSQIFKQLNWDAVDIIGNDTEGRKKWCEENNLTYRDNLDSVERQIYIEKPDFLYCQDLSFFPANALQHFKRIGIKLAAQHSCPWAGDQQVREFNVVFTSFPHYMDRIRSLGVETSFLPIAFGGEYVYRRVTPSVTRPFPITFVGGINAGSGHWAAGTAFLDYIAQAYPDFKWWGYAIGNNIPQALKAAYQGEAWGTKMYEIYSKSKVVVNRHGEVAQGFSNNMRMFEATGMGAVLATEESLNLNYYFHSKQECIAYSSKEDAVLKIGEMLMNQQRWESVATAGQQKTQKNHTYALRLFEVEKVLRSML